MHQKRASSYNLLWHHFNTLSMQEKYFVDVNQPLKSEIWEEWKALTVSNNMEVLVNLFLFSARNFLLVL